ncbi:unnamed protein product [Mortierella alpina]
MADRCSRICEKDFCPSSQRRHCVQARRLSGRKHQLSRRRGSPPPNSVCSYAHGFGVHKSWEYKAAVSSRTTGLSGPRSVPVSSWPSTGCRRQTAFSLESPSVGGLVLSPSHPLSSRALRSLKSALLPRPYRLRDQGALSFSVAPPQAVAPSLDTTDPLLAPLNLGRRSSLRAAQASQFTTIGGTAQMLVMSGSMGSGGIGRDGLSPMSSVTYTERIAERSRRVGTEEEGEGSHCPTPTPYTFRRRNAIVEGTEDAPRAIDFRNVSARS